MIEFEFKIFCQSVDMNDDSFLDLLYEAGCDDALISFKDGYACLDFSRASENAEDAVVSAVKGIQKAGVVGHIERIEPDDLASLSTIAKRVGVTRASLQKYARGVSKVGKDFPQPIANISGSKRELFSTAQVMNWMCKKNKVQLPRDALELCNVIAKTNQALIVAKAHKDVEIQRLLSRLTA